MCDPPLHSHTGSERAITALATSAMTDSVLRSNLSTSRPNISASAACGIDMAMNTQPTARAFASAWNTRIDAAVIWKAFPAVVMKAAGSSSRSVTLDRRGRVAVAAGTVSVDIRLPQTVLGTLAGISSW